MVCAMTSRVVPGMAVTIANSAPASALSSELLPAFGCPAITTLMPSRNNTPCCVCCTTASNWLCNAASWPEASAFFRKSISSSGKSKVASTSMRSFTSCVRNCWVALEKAPLRLRAALRTACSVLASIKSATASAWVRSILLFRNARWVNSPGWAKRKTPATSHAKHAFTSICKTTGPPCACSSSTSSPV